MRYPFYLLLTVATFAGTFSFAASVLKLDEAKQVVTLKDVNSNSLRVDDEVCLFSGQTLTACGRINAVAKNYASVSVTEWKQKLSAGAEVSIRNNRRNPSSSTAEVSETFNTRQTRTFGLAAGVTAGTKYFYPNLHLQLALGRDFTVGLMPMYASYSSSTSGISGYGGYLTFSYYHTHSALRGLEFEAGVGAFSVEGTSGIIKESTSGPAAKATVGWRGKALWDLGLDIGVAGGIQYVSTKTQNLDISFSGVLPMISAYIGWSI